MISHVDSLARQEHRERLRDANPIEEVIQDYIPLLPDGGHRFKAKCPFHQEKSPSFKVDTVRGTYHCFGCGERGDVFSFLMKMENLDFPDTIDRLCDRAGLPRLERGARDRVGGSEPRTDRRAASELLARVERWFQAQFLGQEGTEARRYLEDRGFTRETIQAFGVGYAPAGWDRLTNVLREWAVPPKLPAELGLVRERPSGGYYDAFRDRVMFPIRALNGSVVGFGGRVLTAKEGEPKYINSPESALFQKGKLLYGHYEGRDTIRREQNVLLMEGYTDVMMAHQCGFPEAVATLGTALTSSNVGILGRFAERVWLVFDGDRAGREAALKAIRLGLSEPMEIRVLLLPEGEDPCEALKAPGGAQSFRQRLEAAPDALSFARDEFAATFGTETGREKQQVATAYFDLVTELDSEIRRRQAMEELGAQLSLNPRVLEDEYRRWFERQPRRRRTGDSNPPAAVGAGDRGNAPAPTPSSVARGPAGRGRSGGRAQPRVEEEAILLAMMGRPDRVELLGALHPAEDFRDPMLAELARRLQHAGGILDVVQLEDPAVKSAWLELEDKAAIGALSEEQCCLLLSGLIARRADRACEAIASELRRVSEAFGDEGRRRRDELALELSQLRAVRVRLQESRRGVWESLQEEARLCLELSAETGASAHSVPDGFDRHGAVHAPHAD